MLAIDCDEHFIDIERVTIASLLSCQSFGVQRAAFDASKADRFLADDNASFCWQVFDITVTDIKSIVEPDSVTDDHGRASMSLVSIHPGILPTQRS